MFIVINLHSWPFFLTFRSLTTTLRHLNGSNVVARPTMADIGVAREQLLLLQKAGNGNGRGGGGGRGFKAREELNHRADILDFFLSFLFLVRDSLGKRKRR